MATNEEITESDLAKRLYALTIIHEDSKDDQFQLDTEHTGQSHERSARGRERGIRTPRERGGSGRSHRGRARGTSRSSAERTRPEDGEGHNDVSSHSAVRGRGRGRGGPNRGRANESRNLNLDKDSFERVLGRVGVNVNRERQRSQGAVNDSSDNKLFPEENIRVLSESKLIALSKSKDDPDTLLMQVDKMSSGFIGILKKPLDPNLVYYVVRILSIVSRSTQHAHLRDIFREVDAHMLNNLTVVLYEISMKDPKFENLWNIQNNIENFLSHIITITTVVMTILSPSLGKCTNLIRAVKTVRDELRLQNIEQEVEELEKLFQKVKENKEQKEMKKTKVHVRTEGTNEPPNSFRDIPIFPELKDLQMDERPFLRANKVKGKYENLETYLDVQFRLLREDYIQPLRKGISEYRESVNFGGNVRRIKELKLYHKVEIMYPVCSGKGINHVIQFDTSTFKNVRWASSRRLLHGSLLCLSSDSFETILYATVTHRDETQLKDGKLEVHFENSEELELHKNKTFVMAETAAYFEAYRFILEGLQEIKDNMPFENYLVSCETTVRPPRYLLSTGGPLYDFSNLLVENRETAIFPVLNTRMWPKADDLGLDSSQYQALQRAITKELAIIQGPPGTGKTFIGLKIAQLLLDNEKIWKKEAPTQSPVGMKTFAKKQDSCPILVVCYTNHALDQFLEGLLAIGKKKIVRIGGRCKNESIEPFVLRNVKRQKKDNKEWRTRFSENDAQCRAVLKECEEKIDLCNNGIKKSETKVLKYKALAPFMTEAQQEAFEISHTEEDLPNCLTNWLGLHEPQEMPLASTYKEQIINRWLEYILKEADVIHESVRNNITDVFALELLQRAELYKAWIKEFQSNVQNMIGAIEMQGGFQVEKLYAILHKASIGIMEADELFNYVRYDSQKHLSLLTNKFQSRNPVFNWLCPHKTAKIKKALEEITDKHDSNDEDSETAISTEDMEEERELDEEDEFVFEMKMKKGGNAAPVVKDDGEWLRTWNEKTFSKKIRHLLRKAKPLKRQEAEKLTHMWGLTEVKRRNLYAFWIENYRRYLKENVKVYEKRFNDATDKLQEVRNLETVDILQDTEIMGMTTTGAAKYRTILQIIRPQIIIVEEAAEVLESHIVTTLNESCQHLILIGDHKQLRPSTTVYALAKKYNMDISLFERMVCNNVPCVTLEEQHRMRPDISVLLTHESLYPNLRDHASVRKYKDVKGVDENFQFITHEEEECSVAESTSYTNPFEAKYIAKLCRYLLNQGYRRDEISVITPYMGQVLLLRKEMPKADFDGVRITAVDNFQGEENEIILLSLVRSRAVDELPQKRNPIGFVGIENRICVSLSRARMGFYVIGNFRLLEQFSEMWAKMISKMRQKRLLREGLRLRCQNHPDTVIFAKTIEDFKNVPEGGCNKSCNAELICGHSCPMNCHPVDRDHERFLCAKPCENIVCKYNHRCKKRCHEPCGLCNTAVEKEIPMCGHKAQMACHIDPFTWKCKQKCDASLTCGHTCDRHCSECTEDKCHQQNCKVEIIRTLECGHQKTLKCHEDPSMAVCEVVCETMLDCKHKCSGNCTKCFGGRIHLGCNASCGKILPCGHKCSSPCSEVCPPCTRPCEFVCSHNIKCKKRCYEKCEPCHDHCKFYCDKHKIKCTKGCNELCNVQPCTASCKKPLACAEEHGFCKGICGEKCICLIHHQDKVRLDPGETIAENSVFIQLPNCYCIFEFEKLRNCIKKESDKRDERLFKSCPHCGTAITKHVRPFTNILKRTKEQIVQKYEILTGTFEERKTKIRKQKTEFHNLESKGLSKTDADFVCQKLQPYNFAALHYTDIMKDRLIKCLEICNKWSLAGADEQVEGIVNPSKLRDMLLKGRRFVTKQYWREVDREIVRMGLWIDFYVLNKRLQRLGSETSEVADIITLVFQVIAKKEFENTDEKALAAVYNVFKSIRGITSLTVSQSKVEAVKFLLNARLKSTAPGSVDLEVDETGSDEYF